MVLHINTPLRYFKLRLYDKHSTFDFICLFQAPYVDDEWFYSYFLSVNISCSTRKGPIVVQLFHAKGPFFCSFRQNGVSSSVSNFFWFCGLYFLYVVNRETGQVNKAYIYIAFLFCSACSVLLLLFRDIWTPLSCIVWSVGRDGRLILETIRIAAESTPKWCQTNDNTLKH